MGFLILLIMLAASLLSCEKKEEQGTAMSVKELVGVKGCPYCHDMRRELLGPSFIRISERYSASDEDTLVESLLKGSRGKWGDRGMPPQKLSEEEARLIVRWILELKDEGSRLHR